MFLATRSTYGDGQLVGTCECGARELGVVAQDWRSAHLGAAWPILVPREQEEPVEAWRERLIDALNQARARDEQLSSALDRRMQVRPGEPYPVISEEDIAATQRVEVLEHQLAGPPFNDLPMTR